MNRSLPPSRSYSFAFPRLDTVIEVESVADRLVVHASRDTFSRDRKACFLRRLAAEGFIAEEWASDWVTVRWIVEPDRFMPDQAHRAKTGRFMRRFLAAAFALWLSLMAFAFLQVAR